MRQDGLSRRDAGILSLLPTADVKPVPVRWNAAVQTLGRGRSRRGPFKLGCRSASTLCFGVERTAASWLQGDVTGFITTIKGFGSERIAFKIADREHLQAVGTTHPLNSGMLRTVNAHPSARLNSCLEPASANWPGRYLRGPAGVLRQLGRAPLAAAYCRARWNRRPRAKLTCPTETEVEHLRRSRGVLAGVRRRRGRPRRRARLHGPHAAARNY